MITKVSTLVNHGETTNIDKELVAFLHLREFIGFCEGTGLIEKEQAKRLNQSALILFNRGPP